MTMRARRMINRGTELPDAALGPLSQSADALPDDDEDSNLANIRRSF